MPKIDVKDAVQKFTMKIENNYYPLDRSKNTEEDYSKEKELRDTNAVVKFADSGCFDYIKNMM